MNNTSQGEFNDSPHNNKHNTFPKYPCPREEYCRTVGEEGQKMIQAALQEIINPIFPKATVFSNPTNGNGPDIMIYDDKLLFLGEVCNFWQNSFINDKRAERIRKNLKGVRHKALFTTFPLTDYKARRLLRHIPKFYTGFQILPQDFYLFFLEKNPKLVLFRKLPVFSTLELLKERLLRFLCETGLIPLIVYERYACSVGGMQLKQVEGVRKAHVGGLGEGYYSSSVSVRFPSSVANVDYELYDAEMYRMEEGNR